MRDRSHLRRPPMERFLEKVAMRDGCWEWQARINHEGYACFEDTLAHSWLYKQLLGDLPAGWTVDHLCCNRSCVRFDHLEGVPHKVNSLRGLSPPSLNSRKTHCAKGHPFDEKNTYARGRGRRGCRICISAGTRRWEQRKKKLALV